MRTAVITTVRGRHEHLRQQLTGLARSTTQPDQHVVVTMNDPTASQVLKESGRTTATVPLATESSSLPVAAARNAGAEVALEGGADLLIFLDVDCIPAAALIDRYHNTAADTAHADALLCGPVTYLPPPPSTGYNLATLHKRVDPHRARPTPHDDQVLASSDYELFWSLSFALTRQTWRRIGGFCTQYRGYGGEDTDFAQLAATAGVTMRWVGGAHAFHQYHPVSDPPVEHLPDVITNARIFRTRWGWWPMRDWLRAFSERGLIRWTDTELEAI